MVNSPLTSLALKIAEQAHAGQVDKSGVPYIQHPLHVAEEMPDELCCAAALLHDVVEDTDWTLEDLASAGIPSPVLEALSLLTHEPGTPYLEYVARLKHHPIARQVKLADLRHNSDLSRLSEVTERDLSRWKRYQKAIALLNDES